MDWQPFNHSARKTTDVRNQHTPTHTNRANKEHLWISHSVTVQRADTQYGRKRHSATHTFILYSAWTNSWVRIVSLVDEWLAKQHRPNRDKARPDMRRKATVAMYQSNNHNNNYNQILRLYGGGNCLLTLILFYNFLWECTELYRQEPNVVSISLPWKTSDSSFSSPV